MSDYTQNVIPMTTMPEVLSEYEEVSEDLKVKMENTIIWAIDIIYLSLATLWGTLGNILILVVIAKYKNFRKLNHIFLAHLAVADLLNSTVILPFILGNVIIGENKTGNAWCKISGVLIIFTCGLSIYSIVLIALQRYLKICKPRLHGRIFRPCNTVAILITMSVFCILCATPPLYGWSTIIYNEEQFLCGYSRNAAYSYNIFIFIAGIVAPTITLVFCYWNVFRELNRTDRLLRSSTNHGALFNQQANLNKKRATITMLLITLMFAICVGPYGILIVADRFNQLPGIVHKIAAFLGLGNSCVNSVILITRCKEFREACERLLNMRCCATMKGGFPSADPLVSSSV